MGQTGDLMDALRSSGALKEGHYLLSSGRHSDQYVEKFDLLRQPRAASEVCSLIAQRFRELAVDVVVGPTTGGVILAFEIARQLDAAAAFAERTGEGSASREFRRGTQFQPGARVLVVDDILTTGGSVNETLGALTGLPVEIVGIAVLVDRSVQQPDFGVPLWSLAKLNIVTWLPDDCPLCARSIPLIKPGTTPKVVGNAEPSI